MFNCLFWQYSKFCNNLSSETLNFSANFVSSEREVSAISYCNRLVEFSWNSPFNVLEFLGVCCRKIDTFEITICLNFDSRVLAFSIICCKIETFETLLSSIAINFSYNICSIVFESFVRISFPFFSNFSFNSFEFSSNFSCNFLNATVCS